MVVKIKKKVLFNKANGHKYVVIPSFLDIKEGDFVILNNKIVAKVWKKNSSLVATIPREFKYLKEVEIDKLKIGGDEE